MPALPDPPPREATWLRIESIVDRFEEAFRQGRQPVLDDFLPPDAENLPNLRLELIVTELELRLREGTAARVEDYLTRYPDLNANREAVQTLLVAEFHLRRLREPNLTIEEYQHRFPTHVTAEHSGRPMRLRTSAPLYRKFPATTFWKESAAAVWAWSTKPARRACNASSP